MERHLCHASHVDTDRRKDTAGANPESEPLVECAALREFTWIDYVPHSSRQSSLRYGVRLFRKSARHPHLGCEDCGGGTGSPLRRRFLPRGDGRAPVAEHRGEDLDAAGRGGGSDRVRPGYGACRLRCRGGAAAVAHSAVRRWRVQCFSFPLCGEVEPRAFFLGKLRSCGYAFFRATRTETERYRSGPTQDNGGSLLARGDQRGLVAGKRADPGRRILLLRCARAAPVCRTDGPSRRGVLSQRRG